MDFVDSLANIASCCTYITYFMDWGHFSFIRYKFIYIYRIFG